jgi:hypothetical protein
MTVWRTRPPVACEGPAPAPPTPCRRGRHLASEAAEPLDARSTRRAGRTITGMGSDRRRDVEVEVRVEARWWPGWLDPRQLAQGRGPVGIDGPVDEWAGRRTTRGPATRTTSGRCDDRTPGAGEAVREDRVNEPGDGRDTPHSRRGGTLGSTPPICADPPGPLTV